MVLERQLGTFLLALGISCSRSAAALDRQQSHVKRPCKKSFEHLDEKWKEVDEIVFPDDPESYNLLFEPQNRKPYEPQAECTQSASLGVHAFITLNLREALQTAPSGSAVVDIGCGTGFLLAVFSTLTGKGVDVVGIDLDADAEDHARDALAKTRDSLLEVSASWKDVPQIVLGNALTMSYPDRFSVINVGFASTELPKHLLQLSTMSPTILMPICEKPLRLLGDKCECRFHLFKDLKGQLEEEVVGPRINFFYVPPAAGDVEQAPAVRTNTTTTLTATTTHATNITTTVPTTYTGLAWLVPTTSTGSLEVSASASTADVGRQWRWIIGAATAASAMAFGTILCRRSTPTSARSFRPQQELSRL